MPAEDMINVAINTTHPEAYVLVDTRDGTQWEIAVQGDDWAESQYYWKALPNSPREMDAVHAEKRELERELKDLREERDQLRSCLHEVILVTENSLANDTLALKADVLAAIAHAMWPMEELEKVRED